MILYEISFMKVSLLFRLLLYMKFRIFTPLKKSAAVFCTKKLRNAKISKYHESVGFGRKRMIFLTIYLSEHGEKYYKYNL